MTKKRTGLKKQIDLINQYRFLHYILYVLFGIILFAALYGNVKPQNLDIKLLDISKQTLYSPISVTDMQETERKKREAYQEVPDQYRLVEEYSESRVEIVNFIFNSAIEVNQGPILKENDETAPKGEEEKASEVKPLTESEKSSLLEDKLSDGLKQKISKDTLLPLLGASPEELKLAKESVVTTVNKVMGKEITTDKLGEAKQQVEKELQYTPLTSEMLQSAIRIGQYAVIPNYIYDDKATKEKRQQAADSVKESLIKQGQIIVSEGQPITPDVYHKLEIAGLINNKQSFKPFLGLSVFVLLTVSVLIYYFENQRNASEKKNLSLLLFVLVFIISLLFMKAISLFQQLDIAYIGLIVPAAMGPMLIKLLISERQAILSSIILSVCGSIVFNEGITGTFNFNMGIYYLAGCLAGVLFLNKHNLRSRILQAGLFVALINILMISALTMIQNGNYSNLEFGSYVIMAAVSGLAASVLVMGFQPFFETGFGLLSTMRLIELSNPNHPLLRKILTETPGTYHHSVMVANLSESACEAIGANGLLARVGAYYHDIGKTKRPQYFIENQMKMDNPHDKLSPQLSKNVIIAHASDGAEMLRKHKMPKEFVDIAEQHHGTSLLKYFYYKAKERGDEILEEEFRYPGPKPQTREIAVISIADSVEAAVRSMSSPTPERIQKLVRGIIADRLQDGQLNECDLTLKELDIVAKSFCESLKGIFHSRIEYPEVTKQKVKQA
ncbi:HD family phosphohydrolase [Bacillus sp. FJAT-42376]|uniref:HD family phosphohydrolase n=1 Tax=Bacillus sp. FJAT-42376 TaxID=2014076 RepID=UPI000F4E7ACD|nr:HD family phosphohydrolase [Bacillus sp. FJAT-42376]AZB43669.1 HD family phosphohydrolase [Bacillus sp. FJAT-42376]